MKAYFLSLKNDTPSSGYWDYALLEDLLDGFEREEVRSLPECDTCGVVIPGRSHAKLIDEVNRELAKVEKVVLFIMGDEESDFPVEEIDHKNITIWIQNPIPGRHDKYRKIGCGYTPHVGTYRSEVPTKSLKFFFAGQVTHSRRTAMFEMLKGKKEGLVKGTPGFTQGYSTDEYCQHLSQAKTVPCPSGPETPDTFRLYEALELGSVPIADEATPRYEVPGYWNWLFGEPVPFPTYISFKELLRSVNITSGLYPSLNNQVQAWWYRKKQQMKTQIRFDAEFKADARENITVIVPVSPINSHPDTTVLEETIGTIRYHLPKSEIIITFDGVRKEQEGLYNQYQEHIRRVLWLARSWKNITPYIFDEHTHQVGMARVALEKVTTPLILYVEQDTPLVIDEPIEWEKLIKTVLNGDANMIRFHFEGVIPEAHKHLMIGEPKNELQKTVQWSQRPHLARTDFYQNMLETRFTKEAKCFIEDKIHGCVQDDWGVHGEKGWEKWKIFIYHPMTGNIKRSYHIDGRHGEKKYDGSQVW